MSKTTRCTICNGLHGLYHLRGEDLCKHCWAIQTSMEGRPLRARIRQALTRGDQEESHRLTRCAIWLANARDSKSADR